ncbi:MAG: HAD-IC family P-type ATPase [Desulfobacterales bacterium]|jgi:magnesium-transporting ATPase (P-type)|nr:HAD-IC family P-type ATPase [Desulfobacterales bacterium]MDD3949780.1 HAD-IC family P-type ATPase [Desulfobacterales bacterium]MDY0377358.1 HAD-IC family P-type ATPase [Desulfobacterales bacterium]
MKAEKHACRLCEEKWHSLEEEAIFQELQSRPDGLNDGEAVERLRFYGPNSLPVKAPPTLWAVLLHQVLNPLIFILLAAAVASAAIGEGTDAVFILVVIALNSGLGAYQEYQAEKSASSLQRLLKIKARVRRSGQERQIPSEEVVPGDIVLLESGNKSPADLRLLQARNLAADESFLTGESVAAEKQTGRLPEDAGVSDRTNMVFAGSTITSGRGLGIVVGTAAETQVGIIAEIVTQSESGKPPLVLRMERFVKNISILVLAISVGIAVLLRYQGYDATAIFFFVVALAVSAIPEGLPVALTVALSIATKRMSERNVIVRKLTAVESLGSCTVIASDKTGTLTVNQQTAREIVLPDGQTFVLSGEGYNGEGGIETEEGAEVSRTALERLQKMAEYVILSNEASLDKEEDGWKHHGDAMDVAFLAMGWKLSMNPVQVRERFKIEKEIPYESERKFSAVSYETEGKSHVAAKGAVETILDFCGRMYQKGEPVDLDRNGIEQQAEAMAEKGLRVLAVAGGETSTTGFEGEHPESALSELFFHGLVGFIDPLRPEAAESIQRCKAAGIKVIMITGDHPSTAGVIASELGLSDTRAPVVTGMELSEAGTPDSPAFEKRVSSSHVFARVSPSQKLEIVDVLIRRGEFVAVTGDGVNDAPALRRANIGVAMGSGTDVAKEVGSMIVADDNFASIVAGIEEGRFAYDNVRKVIYLLISTGAAEVAMFIAAVLAGLPIPLLAVQLLWLNLVTNGIQDVALAFEGGEPGAMKRKPRAPEEKIFDRQMIGQTLVSGLAIGMLAFASWYWMIKVQTTNEASARNMILLLMVLLQNVHVFNCRSEKVSAFMIPIQRNLILVFGVLAAQGIHVLSMHAPFMQGILGTEPVRFNQWLIALALALVVLVVMEVFKRVAGGRYVTG